MNINKQDCIAFDKADPLRHCQDRFTIEPGQVYLDGNSLGALPNHTPAQIENTIKREWGVDLIKSWNKAGWFELAGVLGDRIGELVGANAGQIVVCDNTTINLFKAIHAALGINAHRNKIIAHKGDFPTDLYIIEGAAGSAGRDIQIELIDDESTMVDSFTPDVAVVVLSQVNYKSGALMDMKEITRKAHEAGILIIWDLCHSAGALSVELDECHVDFAIGCSYKYLNGGPGAPAFIYAAKQHHNVMKQPLSGWWSHSNPFDFAHQYTPAEGIKRMLSGTQPILSLCGVGAGLDTFSGVSMDSIRQKSMALCQLFMDLVTQQCSEYSLDIIGPVNSNLRGSHVSIAYEHGYPVVQAMIEQGVTGDFRAPNLMRFGFTPLYISYEQIWNAVSILKNCLDREVWKDPNYARTSSIVT
ncbi:MAG: kynureninase [Gammaproteobacteria bacterium]|nr:kynureninase [Gammaproteobacteria bacterium]